MKRKALGGDYMVNVLSVGGTTPIPSFKKQKNKTRILCSPGQPQIPYAVKDNLDPLIYLLPFPEC